jgi:hypothetical protein
LRFSIPGCAARPLGCAARPRAMLSDPVGVLVLRRPFACFPWRTLVWAISTTLGLVPMGSECRTRGTRARNPTRPGVASRSHVTRAVETQNRELLLQNAVLFPDGAVITSLEEGNSASLDARAVVNDCLQYRAYAGWPMALTHEITTTKEAFPWPIGHWRRVRLRQVVSDRQRQVPGATGSVLRNRASPGCAAPVAGARCGTGSEYRTRGTRTMADRTLEWWDKRERIRRASAPICSQPVQIRGSAAQIRGLTARNRRRASPGWAGSAYPGAVRHGFGVPKPWHNPETLLLASLPTDRRPHGGPYAMLALARRGEGGDSREFAPKLGQSVTQRGSREESLTAA